MSETVTSTTAAGADRPIVPYKALWAVLLMGWVVSYADRTVTGPVIAWMISNEAGFIGDAANPATLGGLVGTMFFTGYMLTQYAGGRLGDTYGHREMVVVSLLWAGIMTAVSGVVTGLIAFVAARVLTGLGEGVFYSNDRTLVFTHTPPPKRTLGLGVVIAGLSIGLTIGIVATPYLIDWGVDLGMGGHAWGLPFYVFAALSIVVAAAAYSFFRSRLGGALKLGPPFLKLVVYSAPTFVAILAIFVLAENFEWKEWVTAIVIGVLALAYIVVIIRGVAKTGRSETLLSRDVWLVYIAYIAILYNLWFFSFWSVQIVREAADSSLVAAGLTAAFNAGAGILGFPVGGWLSDVAVRAGIGRKPLLIGFTSAQFVLTLIFGFVVAAGIMIVSFFLYLMVKEAPAHHEDPVPA